MNLVCQHECNEKAQKSNSVNAFKATMEQPSRTIVHAKLEMTNPDSQEEVEADAAANDIVQGGKIARSILAGSSDGGMAVSTQMESRLNSLQGGGQVMPDGLRNMMERGFNRDFSQVRLHTDSEAASLSSGIHAKAFTHGNDIYFNQGQFSPNTSEGQKLMAHELTHVVQGGGKVGRSPNCETGALEDGVKNKIKEICNKVLPKLKTINNFGGPNLTLMAAYTKYVCPSCTKTDLKDFCTKLIKLLQDLNNEEVLNSLTVKQCHRNKRNTECEVLRGEDQINPITCYNPYINHGDNYLEKAFTIIHEFSHMRIKSKDTCYWGSRRKDCGSNEHKDEDKSNVASAIEFFIRELYEEKNLDLGVKQESTPVRE